jgi:NTP pyrophosphatase (non-canonical NTP hydrolase)
MKTFSEYEQQRLVLQTICYPLAGRNMVYPALKLAGESGELADKIGKHWRNAYAVNFDTKKGLKRFDDENDVATHFMSSLTMSKEQRKEVIKELGDILWYVTALASEFDTSLEQIAEMNIEKLTLRKQRGTVLGEGDNR